MTILYAIVAKPGEVSKVLAEFSKTTGNFKQVTATILGKITDAERKASLVSTVSRFRYPSLFFSHPLRVFIC